MSNSGKATTTANIRIDSSPSSASNLTQSTLDRFNFKRPSTDSTSNSISATHSTTSSKRTKFQQDVSLPQKDMTDGKDSAAMSARSLIYDLTSSPIHSQSDNALFDGVVSGSNNTSTANAKGKGTLSSSFGDAGRRVSDGWGSRPGSGMVGAVNHSASPVSSGGPKKLIIKGFKNKPTLPVNYEADTWQTLRRAVRAIHESQPVPDSKEELYKLCENLCLHKMASGLYTKLQAECEEHVQSQVALLQTNGTEGEHFLQALETVWTSHCQQMILIRSIFLYLDRTYVLQTSWLLSLWEMGLDLFKKHVMGAPDIKKKAVEGLLNQIRRERDGEVVSKPLLKTLFRALMDLGIYVSVFETPFLDRTETYYRAEADRQFAELEAAPGAESVARYLRHVEERLRQETDRCSQLSGYLDLASRKPLITVVETELVKKGVKLLLEKGFDDLMIHDRADDLSRLYQLLGRVQALDQMRTAFGLHIKKSGLTLVNDPSRDPTMVTDLLAFKLRLDNLLVTSFAKNELFGNSMKESFEHFINQRQNKPAELIAKHLDGLLKSGKGVTEEEVESMLDRCLVLFRFIHGKDVFEAFYKKDLAKRLLLNKSGSVDAEKSMLIKLKTECGAGFTSKLEGMFKDVELSKDIMISFNASPKHKNQLESIDLGVSVLTAVNWPTYPPAEALLPTELEKCQNVFKSYYEERHSGKKLTWVNSLGHCVLKASFPKGVKELSVSLFQAIVMLLFNTIHGSISFSDIQSQTRIEPKELSRTLQSLACGKVRVLTKTPKGREVDPNDVFEFNETFDNALYRIKVNAIQMKETVEEQKRTEEGVFQDRQYQVDAAIVRIMKTRKQLSHTLLIAELYEQLKFPIKPQDLKKRIESLIEREYLERGDDELSRTLQSLACGKVRILTKTQKGRDVDLNDVFEFSETFGIALYRIRVNAIQTKETAEEQKGAEEGLFPDRQYQSFNPDPLRELQGRGCMQL
ncbi:hypothetical protein SmJEL517_g01214 [Synchytrium microbalum]|uniref:Cullin-4 n=1 Tax=Synchytrium microbalum TaxID=1806994 RepID=A0A507CGE3_9FUNG|nr:uncharacterized protein SmJEL517_g01214 [Synchytrium microbalum]TPX36563.1 hypothetical protein SmJEL517_g01214 [Synchytrium microbalum]